VLSLLALANFEVDLELVDQGRQHLDVVVVLRGHIKWVHNCSFISCFRSAYLVQCVIVLFTVAALDTYHFLRDCCLLGVRQGQITHRK